MRGATPGGTGLGCASGRTAEVPEHILTTGGFPLHEALRWWAGRKRRESWTPWSAHMPQEEQMLLGKEEELSGDHLPLMRVSIAIILLPLLPLLRYLSLSFSILERRERGRVGVGPCWMQWRASCLKKATWHWWRWQTSCPRSCRRPFWWTAFLPLVMRASLSVCQSYAEGTLPQGKRMPLQEQYTGLKVCAYLFDMVMRDK